MVDTSLHTGSFRFRDLGKGRLLTNYLARECPKPERFIHGLQDLLVNAVGHDNPGISYSEKSELILEGVSQKKVRHRLQLPEYRVRYVEVHFQSQPEALHFTIQDQDEGFDWESYLNFSPEHASDLHRRGIARWTAVCFDQPS
jgi:hypothetical protein